MRTHLRMNGQLWALAAITVVVMLGFSTQTTDYLTLTNFQNILLQSAAVVIAAVGMTFVLTAGGIDLSVGSTMILTTVVGLSVYGVRSADAGETGPGVYVVVIGLAVVLGALNGYLITKLRVHPLLITLATLNVYRGIALHITEAGDRHAGGAIQAVARGSIVGIGLPVLIAVLLVVGGEFALRKTVFGRHIIAMGGSRRSAVENGIPVNRLQIVVYALSGLCAGIAAVVIAGRIGTVQTSLGSGFEFTVITAVIVGGTSLLGGRGTVVGSALGALLLAVIDNGLNLVNASIYFYDIVRGLVLVLAVLTDVLITRRMRQKASVSRRADPGPPTPNPAPTGAVSANQ
jgi:ribose transport system permease protein